MINYRDIGSMVGELGTLYVNNSKTPFNTFLQAFEPVAILTGPGARHIGECTVMFQNSGEYVARRLRRFNDIDKFTINLGNRDGSLSTVVIKRPMDCITAAYYSEKGFQFGLCGFSVKTPKIELVCMGDCTLKFKAEVEI